MVLVYPYSGHVKLLECPTASFLFFQIVNLIEETGHFHITNTTFDFDLCSLDKTTVRKLQSYLETSGTSWGFSIWLRQKLFFKWRMQNDVTKMEGEKNKNLFSFYFSLKPVSWQEKKWPDSEDHSSQEENALEEFAWIALKNKHRKKTCS